MQNLFPQEMSLFPYRGYYSHVHVCHVLLYMDMYQIDVHMYFVHSTIEVIPELYIHVYDYKCPTLRAGACSGMLL